MNYRQFVCQTFVLFLILVLLIYGQVSYEHGKKRKELLELDKLLGLDLPEKDNTNDESSCGGCSQTGEIKPTIKRQGTFYFHDYLLSYEDCISVKHPCLGHYCPPGMECYMFQPDEFCDDCEAEANCRPIN